MKQRTFLKEEMKRDLMVVYREVAQKGECKTQTEAYEQTVSHGAPRFYVDARWAHVRISPMLRGERGHLEKMGSVQRQLYEDLFDVVVRLSQKEKFWGASLSHILRYAVQEPAPRFYIGAARMGQIWTEKTRRRQVCNKDNFDN